MDFTLKKSEVQHPLDFTFFTVGLHFKFFKKNIGLHRRKCTKCSDQVQFFYEFHTFYFLCRWSLPITIMRVWRAGQSWLVSRKWNKLLLLFWNLPTVLVESSTVCPATSQAWSISVIRDTSSLKSTREWWQRAEQCLLQSQEWWTVPSRLSRLSWRSSLPVVASINVFSAITLARITRIMSGT